jgi:cystathionine gamma-synthase
MWQVLSTTRSASSDSRRAVAVGIAVRRQRIRHALAVIDVHLAAIGLDEDLLVCHSLTKYLCGHGDALGGAVIGRADRMAGLRRDGLIHMGGALSPFSAYLILRGMETLVLRMERHEANARKPGGVSLGHTKVRGVNWPGLRGHPGHDIARAQMRNFSGLLSFSVKAGRGRDGAAAGGAAEGRLYAVSLGSAKTLCFFIPTDDILRSSFPLTGADEDAYRDAAGDGVFRISVGLEDADDIIADFAQALG